MFKNNLIRVAVTALLFTPVIAFAQQKNLASIITLIIWYFNQILVLLIGLAVVIFVWYIIQYFIKPNEDRKNAGQYVMYSLIGFFVILSLWGLVNILQNTFGLQNQNNQPASWTSFQGLFPVGGGSGSGGFNTSPGASGSGGFNTSPRSGSGGFNTNPNINTGNESGIAPDNR